jgi:putative ABC transport system ATP-binding protein
MSLIALQQVHKYYRMGQNQIAALQDVNLEIAAGEFVAVWGPSGSGKSTLCNLVGLLDNPSLGEVFLNGKAVSGLDDDRLSELRNSSIGFVFQNFNLIPVLTALENVMLPLQVRGQPSKEAASRAFELLDELELSEHVRHRPDKLSGGQQQRVAIARALITDPAIVIADEPTANLDSITAVKIITLMRKLNERRGTTFLFSTHDQRLLDRVSRHVLLRDGSVAQDEADGALPAFLSS